jgi:hypothetical protein
VGCLVSGSRGEATSIFLVAGVGYFRVLGKG